MHNQHRSPDPTKIERATATSTVALSFFNLILTVNTHKYEVMCFNSRSDNRLPPLYYDGTQLSYTDTFKYLDMMCDKSINLTTAADAALRLFTAGTFRVKKCVQENFLTNRLHAHTWLL